jgi:hypothetical protein
MTADPPSRNDGPDPGLDVDAAFAEIVAHWDPPSFDVPEETGGATVAPEQPGTRAPSPPASGAPSAPSPPSNPPAPQSPPEAGWRDPLNSRASWEDEGHFVPPTPPPLPSVEPRRRLAWIGLAGSPVVGLLLILLQVAIPRWVSSFLVCAFVGGFCYLVATMGQRSSDDWSGDDGAVL